MKCLTQKEAQSLKVPPFNLQGSLQMSWCQIAEDTFLEEPTQY